MLSIVSCQRLGPWQTLVVPRCRSIVFVRSSAIVRCSTVANRRIPAIGRLFVGFVWRVATLAIGAWGWWAMLPVGCLAVSLSGSLVSWSGRLGVCLCMVVLVAVVAGVVFVLVVVPAAVCVLVLVVVVVSVVPARRASFVSVGVSRRRTRSRGRLLCCN